MDIDLELAANFVALVDSWHYGRAADELFLSTSALSKRIRRLETQVGTPLVERGPEGLTGLTPAGLQFVSAARPLLRQARSATEAARMVHDHGELRVAIPSGTSSFLRWLSMDLITAQFRQLFPTMGLSMVEIPFPMINDCLSADRVDVLFTIAPLRRSDVESMRLPVTSNRIGIVSDRHAFATAGEVTQEQMCGQVLLHNPTLPEEWMQPFWFGDVRTRADAQLATSNASSTQRVYHDLRCGSVAIVTLSPERGLLPPHLEVIDLTGAPPIAFYAARRRTDRHKPADAYISLLQKLPPATVR